MLGSEFVADVLSWPYPRRFFVLSAVLVAVSSFLRLEICVTELFEYGVA